MGKSIPKRTAKQNQNRRFDAGLWLKMPFAVLLDVILPPTCLVCHTRVSSRDNAGALCPHCWGELTPLSPDDADVAAMLDETDLDSFHAPYLYNETAGGIVHQLKYNDGLRVAKFMARQMNSALHLTDCDLIVPVPLHPSRLRQRKYNQSAVLVHDLARMADVPVNVTALKRVRRTASQVGQPAKVRRRQLRNAFWADGNIFVGKEVLLVDDVCTTGSTAHWCAKALKEAGAKKVNLLTFAYVPPKL